MRVSLRSSSLLQTGVALSAWLEACAGRKTPRLWPADWFGTRAQQRKVANAATALSSAPEVKVKWLRCHTEARRWNTCRLTEPPTVFTGVIMLFILYMVIKETWVNLHSYTYVSSRLLRQKRRFSTLDTRFLIDYGSYACLRVTDIAGSPSWMAVLRPAVSTALECWLWPSTQQILLDPEGFTQLWSHSSTNVSHTKWRPVVLIVGTRDRDRAIRLLSG